MTSPADDCGVRGGCRACPLFAANVCGDPAPDAPTATINDRGYLRRVPLRPGDVDHARPLPEAGDACNLRPVPARFDADYRLGDPHACGPGCAADPLGDPAPEPCATLPTELPGMWEPADFLGGAPDEVRPPAPDANCVTLGDGSCVSELPCMHTPPPARFAVNGEGVVTDRGDPYAALLSALARRGWEPVSAARVEVWALAEAAGVLVDPASEPGCNGETQCGPDCRLDCETPDIDPAEPKPDGAGCCGGGCGG